MQEISCTLILKYFCNDLVKASFIIDTVKIGAALHFRKIFAFNGDSLPCAGTEPFMFRMEHVL